MTCASPRSRISCSCRCPKAQAISGSSSRTERIRPTSIARSAPPIVVSRSRSIRNSRCSRLHKSITISNMADSCGHSAQAAAPATNKSGRKVMCVKFQKELAGLDTPPWPGELGQRIYENVSKDAWKLWEERMKMILNEYRLMPWQKEAQDLVAKHMEDFFFGEG